MRRRGQLSFPALAAAALALVSQPDGALATCELTGGKCLCTDTDGDIWDLSALSGENGATGPGSSIWTFSYSFNFCENMPLPVGPSCSPISPNGATAFRVEDYDPVSSALCHVMGPDGPGTLAVSKRNNDADQGVTIEFTTVTYQLTVNLACDVSLRGSSTTATPPTNYASSIVIDWNTFETCPNAPGHPFYVGGLSFGWVFIIVVCVGGVLYVGGGYAYNSQKNGLSGKDALPHQSFWQNVVQDGPELVADGVWFTRHKLATTFAFLEFLDPPPRKGQDPEDPFTDALEREKNSLVAPAGDGSGRKKKKKKKSSKDSKASSKDSKSKKKTYLDSEQEPEDPVQRVASVGDRVANLNLKTARE